MLQIGYVIICEDVIKDGNQTIIKKPLPIIAPLNLPGNFSFKVAFSLHNLNEDDFGKENTVRILFKDENGKKVFDTDKLKLRTDASNKPGDSMVEIAEADLGINNIDLFEEGIYTLILTVNNESAELKIPVRARGKTHESR